MTERAERDPVNEDDFDYEPVAGARAELKRLLADRRAYLSRREAALLRYLGENALSANPVRVREQAIAVDVFGRNNAFDPRTDPIARVEMSRLRRAVEQYYSAFAGDRPVQIALPRREYVLEFIEHQPSPATTEGQVIDEPPASPAPIEKRVVDEPDARAAPKSLDAWLQIAIGGVLLTIVSSLGYVLITAAI